MGSGEGFQLYSAEHGLDVYPNYLLVSLIGTLAHGVPNIGREPAIHVLPKRQLAGVEDEPPSRSAIALVSFSDTSDRVFIDSAALRASCHMDGVASTRQVHGGEARC